MDHKKQIQQFLTAIANDKYEDANELFPKILKSTVTNIINNNKSEVLKKLNAGVEQVATSSLEIEKTSN